MEILQINNVFPVGSTGKIVYDIHNCLIDNSISSLVVYGRGEESKVHGSIKVCSELYAHLNKVRSMISGLMYGGCFFSTNKIIRLIKKTKPNVVHLHCINGYFVNVYRLVNWLKKNNINTVLTLHAEFLHTGNCGHALDCEKWKNGCGKCPRLKQETLSLFFDRTKNSWMKMKKAFEDFDNLVVVSVSPWLMNRAKQSPILKDKRHVVVLNGLDENIFYYRKNIELKKKYNIPSNKCIVFHATPGFNNDLNHIKGGYFLLELAKIMTDSVFIVAGPYNNDFLIPKNVIMLGKVSNQNELANLYSIADVTLLVSKRETFSMVTAESLCCGTPVVGFKAGGPESIAIPDFSEFVEYGDINLLKNSITRMKNKKLDKSRISLISISKYSKKVMFEKYNAIYKEFEDLK